MDCCGGLVVDNPYLCALFNQIASGPFVAGSKVLTIDSAGNCGVSTAIVQQTRARFVTTPQAIAASGTATSISWIVEDVDTLGLITPPGTTFTIPTGAAGMYEIEFGYTLASAPASTFVNAAQVVVAGTIATAAFVARTYAQSNALRVDQHVKVGPIPLGAADTIVCQAVQGTASAINANSAYCHITRIGT